VKHHLVHLESAVHAVEAAIDELRAQEVRAPDPGIWPREKRLRHLLRQMRAALYIERTGEAMPASEILTHNNTGSLTP
jgi:hypothetical protein